MSGRERRHGAAPGRSARRDGRGLRDRGKLVSAASPNAPAAASEATATEARIVLRRARGFTKLEKDMETLQGSEMTALQRLVGLIWGFPPVRTLTGGLSFLKEGARQESADDQRVKSPLGRNARGDGDRHRQRQGDDGHSQSRQDALPKRCGVVTLAQHRCELRPE